MNSYPSDVRLPRARHRLALILSFSCSVSLCGAPAFGQRPWRIDPNPLLEISGDAANPAAAFDMVTGITRLASGTIVVADGRLSKIVFFAPSGAFAGTFGRSGRGPGEFSAIFWMGRCGTDSLFVYDLAQRELTGIDSARHILFEETFPSDGAAPALLTCNSRGEIAYLRPTRERVSNPGGWVDLLTQPYIFSRAKGMRALDTTRISQGEMVLGRPSGVVPRPLGKATSLAMTNSDLFVATGSDATISIFEIEGGKSTELRIPFARARATRHHLEAAIADLVEMIPAERREVVRSILSSLPMPDFLPPYSKIIADETGTLWFISSPPGNDITHLEAYSGKGALRASLTLPRNIAVHEIGRDYVLGVTYNADGLPQVVVHRLNR